MSSFKIEINNITKDIEECLHEMDECLLTLQQLNNTNTMLRLQGEYESEHAINTLINANIKRYSYLHDAITILLELMEIVIYKKLSPHQKYSDSLGKIAESIRLEDPNNTRTNDLDLIILRKTYHALEIISELNKNPDILKADDQTNTDIQNLQPFKDHFKLCEDQYKILCNHDNKPPESKNFKAYNIATPSMLLMAFSIATCIVVAYHVFCKARIPHIPPMKSPVKCRADGFGAASEYILRTAKDTLDILIGNY